MATLEIEQDGATPAMVQEAWAEILSEMAEEGNEARASVERLGADPDELSGASLKVEQNEGDFGATILITGVAPVAVHVLNGLWDDHVRPRLRKRHDVDGGSRVE